MTLVDPTALGRLGDDLADSAFPTSLAHTFVRLLPTRLERIEQAVAAAEPSSLIEAALSLRSGSVTIGAVELAQLATRLIDQVRSHGVEAARSVLAQLPNAVARTESELCALLTKAARS